MPSSRSTAADTVLEWTVHLAAMQPVKAVAAAVLCLAAVGLAAVAFSNVVFPLVTAWLLFASLAEFFLPVTYKLTTQGAEARHLWTFAKIEWGNVKRRYLCEDGVKLSPLSSPSRLESFRGVFLRFGRDNREEILNAIKRF
ncbi:MAG: hypothetical protein ACP5R4_07460 [Armatimonadota bacterium]